MSTHKPRGYSVNDFLSWHERQELVLQPKFQRRDVWSPKAKSHLIDTILRGLPIPIIFIRQDVDPQKRRTIREVVDGQQRLRSVISYSKDEFPVLKSQNPTFGGQTFRNRGRRIGDGRRMGDVASGHSYWVSARSRRHTCACFAPRRAALGMAAGCTPRTGARGRPGWPRTSTQR